jgi:phenylpropionate dioxygenase-like ring-hydroxylating dioxygenase large terminal subunit
MDAQPDFAPSDDVPPGPLHARYPELGSGPIPVEPYISPAWYVREKTHIFKKVWQHVGRVEELPNPGSYLCVDLPASDANIIVIRGDDGVLHAMHNVCSHRLNKLVYEERGRTPKLFCQFHGWTYELDGRISRIPEERAFGKLDHEACRLTQVSVDTWGGFVFVNVDPAPRQTLREFLGPLIVGLESYPFGKLTNCFAWRTVVRANWKLAIDAFQELYHVGFVHGRSIAGALRKDEHGSLTPIDALCGEHHRRLSIAGNPQTVYGNPNAASSGGADLAGAKPIAAAALRLGRNSTKEKFDSADLPDALNWKKDPDWAFDINCIFPDFYLSLRPNYMQAYNFRPLSHNETLFDARVFYPEVTTAGGRFYQEYMKVALRDVLLEDLSTLEHTQQAAETGAKKHMILQDNEIMVRHQLWVVQRMLREAEQAA